MYVYYVVPRSNVNGFILVFLLYMRLCNILKQLYLQDIKTMSTGLRYFQFILTRFKNL